LAKVVVFEPNANSSELVHRVAERMKSGKHPGYEGNLTFEADDGMYSFLKFETRWMLDFLEVLKSLDFPPISLSATGGGAFKVRPLAAMERALCSCHALAVFPCISAHHRRNDRTLR